MSRDAAVLFVPRDAGEVTRQSGGVRRDAQIWELLTSTGIPSARIESFAIAPASKLRRAFEGAMFAYRQSGTVPLTLSSLRHSAITSAVRDAYCRVLSAYPRARVLILGNTWQHVGMARAALDQGLKVLCLPHNIESLSTGQCRHDLPITKLRPMHEELAALGIANATFCISFEEQWLLRGFGIDADLLPYYPPNRYRAGLENIRNCRRTSTKDHILLIGSAFHAPTREGMSELINMLSAWPSRTDRQIIIAGYGSEELASLIPTDGFRVAGSVSDEELNRLLTAAQAVLVHQRAGCGALTRIPELLFAGIPVIANTIAARTYHGYSGVHIYSYKEELYALLNDTLPDPPVQLQPRAAEEKIISLLRSWVESES